MAEEAVKSGFYSAIGLFFEYDTPKIVHIKSKKVGIINRILQLTIVGYIIGYAIIYERGYQEFDNVESATTTKLKGVSYTNGSLLNNTDPNNPYADRVWDVADYVIPPQENDAFFVMTNTIITRRQTQSTCPEDDNLPHVKCKSDSDCPAGVPVINGNGVRTGKCAVPNNSTTQKVCWIHAWCPVEVDELPIEDNYLLQDASNFTVLLKNNIQFPKFDVKRRNILDTQDKDYLTSCHFNLDVPDDRLCPIFRLGDIVSYAGEDFDEIAVLGGVIAINIEWNCNLDHSIDNCLPKYSFRRLDDKDVKLAKGWNFRYANYYYMENTTEARDLIKAYGIRFVIHVTGEAGKFSVVPLLLNIGSGLGLLAIATVLCDIVVLYILKKGPFYKEKKYQYVVGEDAFKGTTDDEVIDDTSEQASRREQEMANPDDDSVKNRKPGHYSRLEDDP